MKTFLVILFLVNGEITPVDGFMPMETPSAEICETRRAFLDDYSKKAPPPHPIAGLGCVEAGSDEEAATKMLMRSGQSL